MKRVVIVPPSGIPVTQEPHVVEIDETDELAELQRLVHGYIQGVPVEADLIVYCNEDGKTMDPPLPPNFVATRAFGGLLSPDDIIVGPVVVMGPMDDEGECASLSDEEIELVLGMVT